MNTPATLIARSGTVTYQCSSPWLPGGGVIEYVCLGPVDAVSLDLGLPIRVDTPIHELRGDR